MDIGNQIQGLLDKIESDNNVKIILAIESGSRAWGFPSIDSDYDIRFVYHQEKDWYLSPFEQPNVIDTVFIGELDAGGWDIGKCMQLMYKGNAALLEWLHSPIVYRQDQAKLAGLKQLAVDTFNSKSVFHHYRSLAKKKILDAKTANNAKSYLYGLRALLCAQWVVDFNSIPPVEFKRLTDCYFTNHSCEERLLILLKDKLSLTEKDRYPIATELLDYSKNKLAGLTEPQATTNTPVSIETYNQVFKKILNS